MNFKMKLIDTPGYGPLIPHAEWYKMIKSYLKKQVTTIKRLFR